MKLTTEEKKNFLDGFISQHSKELGITEMKSIKLQSELEAFRCIREELEA